MEKRFKCNNHRSCFVILLFCIFVFVPTLVCSQTVTHTGVWTSVSDYSAISNSKWNYLINPQVRFIDNRYKLHQINLYMGLGYSVNDDLDLVLGVFRNYIQETSGSVSGENRFWQQASASLLEKSSFNLMSRSRFEERVMNGTDSYANRFRQLISLELPFVKETQLIIGNEFFLQLNEPDWVSQRTYAQNRFNVGVRNKIGEMAFEMGYLNQYNFNNTNEMTNVLYFNIGYSRKYSHTTSDILLDS